MPAYVIKNELDAEPPSETRTILYRISAEALANVRKHARAEHVDVTLDRHAEAFRVRIHDDGVGFAADGANGPRPGHLGLASMRERAELAGGRWRIESTPGAGTTVEFEVPPLVREEAAEGRHHDDPLSASA